MHYFWECSSVVIGAQQAYFWDLLLKTIVHMRPVSLLLLVRPYHHFLTNISWVVLLLRSAPLLALLAQFLGLVHAL